VEAEKGEAVLRVQDTGVGIAPEVLPLVFEAFVREGAPAGRPTRGSGVGLLLVRTLVELHGGRVEAFSAGRGQGSQFVVRIPEACSTRTSIHRTPDLTDQEVTSSGCYRYHPLERFQ